MQAMAIVVSTTHVIENINLDSRPQKGFCDGICTILILSENCSSLRTHNSDIGDDYKYVCVFHVSQICTKTCGDNHVNYKNLDSSKIVNVIKFKKMHARYISTLVSSIPLFTKNLAQV